MLENLKKLSFCRKLISTALFIIFLWLLMNTRYDSLLTNDYPVNMFSEIDFFAVVNTFIANRSFEIGLFLTSLIIIIVTLLFGRVFCSWICPLGYINQLISKIKFKLKQLNLPYCQYFKYYFLVFIVILSILGVQIAGLFDPISITVRSMSLSVIPFIAFIFNKLLDLTYNTPFLNIFYAFGSDFYNYIFSNSTFNFKYAILTGIIFLVILALNLLSKRFWCSNICPLGTLLGLISRYSLFKVTKNKDLCTGCDSCNINCHGNADPAGELKYPECMVCGNCIDCCSQESLKLSFMPKIIDTTFKPQRRYVLIAGISSLIALPLVNLSIPQRTTNLIRPPGALKEKAFINKCINCGECIKVCPNNAIQFTLLEAGIEGIFTPVVIPRIGYCEYQCNLCSKVCPTGAIAELTLAEKQQISIGKAQVNTSICKTYACNSACLVCEEHCPIPNKAIKAIWVNGVGRPVVDEKLCIGCGICEYKCPMEPASAIVVVL